MNYLKLLRGSLNLWGVMHLLTLPTFLYYVTNRLCCSKIVFPLFSLLTWHRTKIRKYLYFLPATSLLLKLLSPFELRYQYKSINSNGEIKKSSQIINTKILKTKLCEISDSYEKNERVKDWHYRSSTQKLMKQVVGLLHGEKPTQKFILYIKHLCVLKLTVVL